MASELILSSGRGLENPGAAPSATTAATRAVTATLLQRCVPRVISSPLRILRSLSAPTSSDGPTTSAVWLARDCKPECPDPQALLGRDRALLAPQLALRRHPATPAPPNQAPP